MSQTPLPGQVVNGHQWDGYRWVPLPPPPPIGAVSNGHRWDGTRWVPIQVAAPIGSVVTELHRFADAWQLTFCETRGVVQLERVVAERKVMLGTARLTYRAAVTVDDTRREVAFTELLVERGTGLSSGGDDEGGMGNGFGFQTTSYNTRKDTVADRIEDQARNYARHYRIDFPYARVREVVAQIATGAGYRFVPKH